MLFYIINFWHSFLSEMWHFFIFLIWSILNSKKITNSNFLKFFWSNILKLTVWLSIFENVTYTSIYRKQHILVCWGIKSKTDNFIEFSFTLKKKKRFFCSEWGTLNFVGCICLSVHLLQNCAAATKFIYLLLISVIACSPSFCVYSYSGVHSHGFKLMSKINGWALSSLGSYI